MGFPGVGASGKANGTSKSPFAPPAADANSFCRDRPVSSGADVPSALAFTNDSTPSATAIAGSSARALRFPASSMDRVILMSKISFNRLIEVVSERIKQMPGCVVLRKDIVILALLAKLAG
jgi:hypothetical protein